MEWIFEFFKKLKQVLTDEVIQRIDTRKGVSLGINSGVSLRLKRARGSGELYVVMRSVIGDYNDHHFTKHEFIQFSNAVETILNSLRHRRVSSAIGEAVEEQPDGRIFEFFKGLKQVLTDEVIQRIDTRNGVSLRLKRARGSGELCVVMRSVTWTNYHYHHFTKHEFIQFSNAVETILNSLKHGDYAGARPLYERALAINEKAHSRRPTFPSSSSSAASFLLRLMYALTYCAGIGRTSCPSAASSRAQ